MEINQFQGITLYAFFEAVAQQTAPLPEDLKQKMSEVGDIFTKDTDIDIDRAINQLADLAQHPSLKPIYELTRQKKQPDYKDEEMNKHGKAKASHNPEEELTSLPLAVVNNLISTLQSSDPQQASDTAKGLFGFVKGLFGFVKSSGN